MPKSDRHEGSHGRSCHHSHRSRSPHRRRHSQSDSDEDRHSRHRYKSDSHKKRRRSPSPSESSLSSSSSSEDDERHKRRSKKSKKEKEKKHKKSKKKSKKKKSKYSIGDQWGKYGVIHEADIFTKEAEFQAWLVDIKHADVETLGNNKRKEMFNDFMEDYNTATLPHEKYYNLNLWEERDRAMRMGERLPERETYNFKNDEEQLKRQQRLAAKQATSKQSAVSLSQEQIEELARVNRERVEADRMRRLGLTPKQGMGVRYEYEYSESNQ